MQEVLPVVALQLEPEGVIYPGGGDVFAGVGEDVLTERMFCMCIESVDNK